MRHILTAILAISMSAIGIQRASSFSFADFIAKNGAITAIQDAQKNAQTAAPINIQPLLDKIYEDLGKLPDERLYVLNAAPDVCTTPQVLDCHGIATATVKPFVAMALDQRKAEHADKATQTSFYLSSGGFAVSLLSLMLSAFGTISGRKKRT